MKNELVGIERMSFTGDGDKQIQMVKLYILTSDIKKEGLVGNMCQVVKLMNTDAKDLKPGNVQLDYMPDGKGGFKVADVRNVA